MCGRAAGNMQQLLNHLCGAFFYLCEQYSYSACSVFFGTIDALIQITGIKTVFTGTDDKNVLSELPKYVELQTEDCL